MLVHIAELVTKGTVIGIRDIRDESSKEGIRVLIEVKNNADPHAVLNQLFKSSRLQESYSANMMGILDGRPVLLTLPVMLHTHVEHRESVIERRAKFDLDKAESRAHILEGLVKAQDRIDDIIAVGKASESREQFELILKGEESIIKAIKTFNFTAAQAKAIAERRLYQLSKLDVNKVKNEFDELQLKITDLREIIDSRLRRLNILLEEMEEMVEKYLPYIGNIQIADIPGRGEPGTGNIDYDKFLSTLDKIGYDKWVALEYVPTAGTVETLKWMEKWL